MYACVFLLAAVLPAPAYALATMIRLGYTNCAVCHLSPQGGGLLTPYGRASTRLRVSSRKSRALLTSN
jgi:hypothetical protein